MNRRLYALWIFSLSLLCLATSVLAQGLPIVKPEEVGLSSERLGRIAAVMQKALDENEIAGAVTLIARKGKVAHLGTFGLMDIEAKKPMHKDTIFRIASMTKPITSVAVMMLYEEGHFLLNDPVSKYIPEFKNPQVLVLPSSEDTTSAPYTTVPAKREITIRDLLTHTSGLTYPWNKHLGKLYKEAEITGGLLQDDSTIGEKMKKLASLPLLHHPGEAVTYGFSTDVLGYLVEVVSGMPLDEFFRTRIFEPLKMKDAHFFLPKEKVRRLATVYRPVEEGGIEPIPEEPIEQGSLIYSVDYPYNGPRSYFSGGGGLCSTISDYARLCQMLLNGGELDGVRLLSRKTIELMTVDHVGDLWKNFGIGLGFGITQDLAEAGQVGSVGAYGWGGFFYTTFGIDPKEQMICIFMSQKYPDGGTTVGTKVGVLAYQAIID
jgi:CubicO group peptidase (beta-lactamase class C family)